MQESLICNIKTCNNLLKSLCQIFSCGHAVCASHSNLKRETCPVCLLNCSSIQIDIPQNSHTIPTGSLVGHSFTDLFSSFSCAIQYWNFQQNILFNKLLSLKDQELDALKSSICQLQNENQSLKSQINSLKIPQTPCLFSPPHNKKLHDHLKF